MESVITEADSNGIITIIAISLIAMIVFLAPAKFASNEVTRRSFYFLAGLCGGVAVGWFSLWPLYLW